MGTKPFNSPGGEGPGEKETNGEGRFGGPFWAAKGGDKVFKPRGAGGGKTGGGFWLILKLTHLNAFLVLFEGPPGGRGQRGPRKRGRRPGPPGGGPNFGHPGGLLFRVGP